MNKSYTNTNNLMITNTYKTISQSDELDISLKDVVNKILGKIDTTKQTKWTKKEPIEKRQADIPNPKLKYSMVRVYELANLYNEIYLLKNKVNELLDEKNKLINQLSEQNRTLLGERVLRKQIIQEEKKRILRDFIAEQNKILDKLTKI
jgi:hypothetical protein